MIGRQCLPIQNYRLGGIEMRLSRFLADELSLGKGSIKMPISDYIAKQRKKYDSMKGKIRCKAYKIKELDGFTFHVKVPSESLNNFYYDVILEFSAAGESFEESHIKIFSNSPSFVYSFAYVFYNMHDDELDSTGFIIDRYHHKIPKHRILTMDSKIGELPLTHPAVMRNPYGLPLFDVTIYKAIFYVLDHFKKNRKFITYKITEAQLFKNVMEFDELMANRNKIEAKEKRVEIKETLKHAAKKLREEALDTLDSGGSVHITKSKVVKMNRSKDDNKSSKVSKAKKIRGK